MSIFRDNREFSFFSRQPAIFAGNNQSETSCSFLSFTKWRCHIHIIIHLHGIAAVAIAMSSWLESLHVFTTLFTRRVCMHGRCHAWPWLSEFSSIVLSCFTLSRSTIFTDDTNKRTVRLVSPHCSRQFFIQCQGSWNLRLTRIKIWINYYFLTLCTAAGACYAARFLYRHFYNWHTGTNGEISQPTACRQLSTCCGNDIN